MNKLSIGMAAGLLIGAGYLSGCESKKSAETLTFQAGAPQSPKSQQGSTLIHRADQESEQGDTALEGKVVGELTVGQRDALSAFDQGDKRLIGVQTRGVSIPGVEESMIAKVRERYGIMLRPVSDVIRGEEDRKTLTEVFQYVRQYNGKMAELLADEF